MKTVVWCVAIALAMIVAVMIGRTAFLEKETPTTPLPRIAESQERIPEVPLEMVILPIAENAVSLNSSETSAEEDIETLDFLISHYRKLQGGNPVGENDEITASLLGKNSKSLVFLRRDSAYIDSSDRLIDRWGTPYFFHAISADKMDIVSAGADLKHHTGDDLTSD